MNDRHRRGHGLFASASELTLHVRTAAAWLRSCTPPRRGRSRESRAPAAAFSLTTAAPLQPSGAVGVPQRAQRRCAARGGTGSCCASASWGGGGGRGGWEEGMEVRAKRHSAGAKAAGGARGVQSLLSAFDGPSPAARAAPGASRCWKRWSS
jgi:hypothetical protein